MFLVIHDDKPIYEMDILSTGQKHIKDYFLIHSALDSIELLVKHRKQYFIGQVKSDDTILYAYVNAIQLRLLLVLGQKKEVDKSLEKNIKQFFSRTNEALAQAFLNPLYKPKDYVKSPIFDEKVKTAVKECLRQVFDRKK